MKRNVALILLMIFLGFGTLFANTYEQGYLDGYADAKLDVPSKYAVPTVQEVAEDDFGMWEMFNFVDSFGDYTDVRYIDANKWIFGTFSNSATRNAELKVEFVIKADYFSIVLYEYGSSLVTGSSNYPTKYTIKVKDQGGEVYQTSGKNYGDRISITAIGVPKLFELLSKGGELKFNITETDSPTTSYNFVIGDSAGFDRILKAL